VLIYDISGKLITTLVNKEQLTGWYEIQWNGTNQADKEVPGGIYLSRVKVGNEVKTNKLTLLR
jgi:flagellar hook assembly protein FlgD